MGRYISKLNKLLSLSGGVGGRLLLFLFFQFAFISSVEAQVRFGIKGGFQLAQMEFNTDALRSSNRAGFFIGPTLKIGLPLPAMTIDASMLFSQHDLKVQDEVFKQKSFVLQGNARIGAGLGEVLGIFLLGGPQFSFNVGDDVVHWFSEDGEFKQFTLQETMLSFNLGAGVTFASHFEAALHYNIPISKTGDFTWQQFSDELFDQTWNHAKTRTNAWSIAFTYFF